MILHRVENIDDFFGFGDRQICREAKDAGMHRLGDWAVLGIVGIEAVVGWARVEKWRVPAADEIAGGC